MQPFNLNYEFYNQPIWLTEEEKQNPKLILNHFFQEMNLIEIRQQLSNIIELALISSNNLFENSNDRGTLLCFIKEIEKMVEAVWLLTEVNQTKI